MEKFLSCDWGTSSFRLRLILADSLVVVAEVKSEQGIAATYNQWQQSDVPDREAYYIAIIRQNIRQLSKQVNISLQGTPVILSGMASSTIGLIGLPYKKMPFNLNGSDLEVKVIDDVDNPLFIISGAATTDDVMRGEETKVVGCGGYVSENEFDKLLILPGTHPKHITLSGGMATGVKTYMTGELFDLLAGKSVLAASVAPGGNINDAAIFEAFTSGVHDGLKQNVLHAAFNTRINQVLKNIPPQHNYYYLSGLLIGAELKDVDKAIPVYLVSGQAHLPLYQQACSIPGINLAGNIDADKALIKGQHVVYSTYAHQ